MQIKPSGIGIIVCNISILFNINKGTLCNHNRHDKERDNYVGSFCCSPGSLRWNNL